jgi:hypothetical protein
MILQLPLLHHVLLHHDSLVTLVLCLLVMDFYVVDSPSRSRRAFLDVPVTGKAS